MANWREIRLGDFCDKIGSGATPRGGNSVYLESGEYSLIRSQNIYNEGFSQSGLAYISSKHAEELDNVEVEADDILLNITGDSVARCCQVPNGILPARVNQHVSIIRPDKSMLWPRFLRYFLISPQMQDYMLGLAHAGATRKALTKGMIESFSIPCPDLCIQKRIAEILGSLDDKIELNRRQNETLEAMARALFQSWFVDFDPVMDNAIEAKKPIPAELADKAARRKAAKGKFPALPKEIRKLFPSEFEPSPLGPIPKGWKVNNVGSFVESVSETYPLKKTSKVIFLNTGDIHEGKFLHSSYSDVSILPGQAKKSIKKDDILYSEIRPENKRFAYVYFDTSEYVVSTKLMVLRATTDIESIFIYFILKQDETIDYLQRMAESRSGTFPQITFNVLSSVE